VPRQRLARTVEEAQAAVADLGYPVVVKPLDANHGRGVSIQLAEVSSVG
jgi:cyanophycin synthetase